MSVFNTPRRAVAVATTLLVLIVAMVVSVGLYSGAQEDQPPPIDRTGAAEELTPIEEAQDTEVLVVVFDLAFEEGVLQGAEVQSSERITSFLPKATVPQGGEWEVTTSGRGSITFYTWNPGRQEAEGDPESEAGFEWVAVSGSVEWVLVVPLSDRGERIEVERLTIVDTATGEVLIETDVG
jgi:hypothetical protein